LWYIYTIEYYTAIKRNPFESVLMSWMNLEPIIKSQVPSGERPAGQILPWGLRGDGSVSEGAPGLMAAPLSLRGQWTPGPLSLKAG